MILSKKHLRFYLQSDMMMNRGYFKTHLESSYRSFYRIT